MHIHFPKPRPPRLIPDAGHVALVTYSIWFQILGLVALIIPEVLFVTTGRDTNPAFLWWLSVLLLTAGTIGRLIEQPASGIRSAIRIVAVLAVVMLLSFLAATSVGAGPARGPQYANAAETLDIAVPFIAGWEGKRNAAYLDIVGVPTICYGSTRGVRLGMVMTDAQCLALLRAEAAEYRLGVHRYLTAETRGYRLPPTRDAAWTSFAFNVGISAAGNSTATRRLNAANVAGACEALTWWNKAGGRVIRGLANRRGAERDLCLAA